jgi:hypothetical protein
MSARLERHARRLAAQGAPARGGPGMFDRAALLFAGSHLTRRQAIGAAAAGSLALAAGRPPRAFGQVQPTCPPPNFPNDTQVCPYTKNGVSGWICCRQDQVCCSKQPLVGDAAAGCCEPGQSCCYSAKLGYYGCCGCPIGLHQCGTEAMTSQCCKRDEVCDVVNFVCRPGDECPNVLCDGACCEPGEQCAGGNCCQASKSCGGTCCGRGMICHQNTCKPLVDYKRPPRRERPKNDKLKSPPLQTFDADVAAELNYRASTGGGSSAGASARGYLIGRARVKLPAHRRRVVHVPLTRRAKRQLRRGKRISAELTLTFRDPSGRRIVETERLTILPQKRPR